MMIYKAQQYGGGSPSLFVAALLVLFLVSQALGNEHVRKDVRSRMEEMAQKLADEKDLYAAMEFLASQEDIVTALKPLIRFNESRTGTGKTSAGVWDSVVQACSWD